MPSVKFMKPTDQPTGVQRLLGIIRKYLEADEFDKFRFVVAFERSVLIRLEKSIALWKEKGNKIEAIIGIDAKGTSKQALEFGAF